MIFRQYSKRKAIRYFKHLDTKELIAFSSFVQERCINELGRDGRICHHLPLKSISRPALDVENWKLSNAEIKKIQFSCRTLFQYYNNVYIISENNCIGGVKEKILPPWMIFPLYDQNSMYWSMGDGEAYKNIFMYFLHSLSEEEYARYQEQYPIPEYMGGSYRSYR